LLIQRPRQAPDGSAIVTLLTPAGALFAGDHVRLAVDVGPGADVTLCQVGATRVHGGNDSPIVVEIDFMVAAEGRLRYHPGELIPFAVADYSQTIRLYLQDGARASLIEVVSPGRLDEHFAYRRVELRTDAYLDGTRILLDILHLEPARSDPRLALGPYTHVATGLRFAPGLTQSDADRVHDEIGAQGAIGSASLLPSYGIGARLVGTAADPLVRALCGLER
jgi:urease accessory protein